MNDHLDLKNLLVVEMIYIIFYLSVKKSLDRGKKIDLYRGTPVENHRFKW